MVSIGPAETQRLWGEKRVTLHGLNWQSYQQILHALPQTSAARLTYDRGCENCPISDRNWGDCLHHLTQTFNR
jgi:hypothetical protein